MPSHGMGVPDGSNRKVVVIDHRQTILAKPNANGVIQFALVPSPFGAVGMSIGDFEVVANGQTAAGANSATTPQSAIYRASVLTPAQNVPVFGYALAPFAETLRPAGTALNNLAGGGITPQSFRVITQTARVMYTGPTVDDQGVACTERLTPAIARDLPVTGENGGAPTANHNAINSLGEMNAAMPESFTALSQQAGAAIFPFRQSRDLINVPSKFEWTDIKKGWIPATIQAGFAGVNGERKEWFPGVLWDYTFAGGPVVPANIMVTSNWGLGHSDITFYSARNLASDQGLVIEVRTCIEYALGYDSPMIRMAALSPPARPDVVEHVRELSRALPSSGPATAQTAEHGWLYNAASWYMRTMKHNIGLTWGLGSKALRAIGQPRVADMTQGMSNMLLSEAQTGDPSPFTRQSLPVGWK